MPPDEWASVRALKENRSCENIEMGIVKPDGETTWLSMTAAPLFLGKYCVVVTYGDITDRKQAELSLKKNEEKLRNILENSTNLFYSHTPDHILTYLSPQIEDILGYTQKEAMINWTDLVSDNPMNEIGFQNTVKAIETGERQSVYELEMVRKDGRKIRVEIREAPIVENGNVVSIVGSLTDITERKIAEDSLRKSETLHREAQRVGKIGHWELDSPSGTPIWSEEIFRIFGLDPKKSEPSFTAHKDIIHEKDWGVLESSIHELSTAGKPFDLEIRIRRTSGGTGWMNAIGSAEKGEKGNVIRMFGTAQDITDRKRFERALRENERRFFDHLNNTPVGAISWDTNFEVVDWNPAAETIFGYSREEAIGRHATSLILPETMREEINFVFKNLLDQKGGTHNVNENRTKDGKRIICDWYNTTLKDSDGTVIGVASFVLDITERKHMDQELMKQKEMAQRYLNLASVMFIGLDSSGHVEIANQKACEILECNEEEIIGLDWFGNFIPSKIRHDIRSVYYQLMDGKVEPVEYFDNSVISKSGKEKLIAWHNTVIKDDNGKAIGILGSGEDITEKKNSKNNYYKLRKWKLSEILPAVSPMSLTTFWASLSATLNWQLMIFRI